MVQRLPIKPKSTSHSGGKFRHKNRQFYNELYSIASNDSANHVGGSKRLILHLFDDKEVLHER